MINGKRVETIEYDVSSSMRRAVAKYETAVFEATGQNPLLYKVDTPFVSEETKFSKHRAPYTSGPFVECPSCYHTMASNTLPVYPEGTARSITKLMPKVGDFEYDSDESTTEPEDDVPDALYDPDTDSEWDNDADDGDAQGYTEARHAGATATSILTREHYQNLGRGGCSTCLEPLTGGEETNFLKFYKRRAASGSDGCDYYKTGDDYAVLSSEWEKVEDAPPSVSTPRVAEEDAQYVPRDGVSRKLCKARGLPEAGKLKRLKYEQSMGQASNGKGHKKPEMHNMFDPRKSKSGEQGQLGHIAAMMLMTLMYSARVARYDILKAINYLAKRITRWDARE